MSFPTTLDDFTNPAPSTPTNSTAIPLSTAIGQLNNAVEAIEAKIGVTGSQISQTVEKRITDLQTANGTVTSDLATHAAASDPHPQYVRETAHQADHDAHSFQTDLRLPRGSVAQTTCYVYRSGATNSGARRYNEIIVFVPVCSGPTYFGTIFGKPGVGANGVRSVQAFVLSRPGLSIPHSAAGAVKVGTWTNDTSTNSESGGYRYSTTAGDTITATVTGDVVGAFLFSASNGGYAVVAIDGDYTAANMLPQFTQQDYVDGLCRQADVGRRYVQCYASSSRTDGFCFARGLSETTHAVKIEVCGTKRAASSSTRVYVESLVGCASTDTIGTSNVQMLPVQQINNQDGSWSAQGWVCRWAPAGSSDLQYLGDTHADGTGSKEVESSWALYCDLTDQTAIAQGTYLYATKVHISHVTTVAHKADLNTTVATKARTYTFLAGRQFPVMCHQKITWAAAGVMDVEFPVALTIGTTINPNRTMANPATQLTLNSAHITLSAANDNVTHWQTGNGSSIVFQTPNYAAFASLVGQSPRAIALLTDGGNAYVERSTLDVKAYIASSHNSGPGYASGEIVEFTVGWGAILDWPGYV